MADITIQDIMTPDPVTVDSASPVTAALSRMRSVGSRHLPVVHKDQLVGILSTKDFSNRGEHVMDIMSPHPQTTTPETPVHVAAAQMAHSRVSCLPVLSRGRLVGIVTTYDMLDALASMVRPK